MLSIGRRRCCKAAALGAASLVIVPRAAVAETVEDIKKRGKVRLGVLGDQPPWCFVDANGKNAGYDVDFGKLLAKEMGVEPEFVTMTVAARIAQLMTNKVDLCIAVMGMYPERAKVVQFSKPYAGAQHHRDRQEEQKIESVADLAKLRVGVTRGAAQDTALTAQVPGADIRRFDDDASAIQALLAGQVDAIGGNTTYMLNINKVRPNNDYRAEARPEPAIHGHRHAARPEGAERVAERFIDKVRDDGELESAQPEVDPSAAAGAAVLARGRPVHGRLGSPRVR